MLSSDDYISVMAVSDQITTTLRINECSSASGQVLATPTNKELIFSFINALVPSKSRLPSYYYHTCQLFRHEESKPSWSN